MTSKAKKSLVRKFVSRQGRAARKVSDAIADLAEPGFEELASSRLLADYLCHRGFRIEWPWRHMPSAFKATWGKGRPAVGLLAEYDALPNCGPEPGQWGHGCGHNLLGVASATGAVAAKGVLETRKAQGKIVVWGCPAEEVLAGKIYMARDGAFRRNDAILSWHPGGNAINAAGGSALDSLLLEFHGKTAHGASAHGGRSALDGVMLLDVAANYLREHVPENVRIHMCVRDGGDAPNVVPAYAKAWYYVRGKDREQVDEVRRRLVACARGAATATGTKVKVTRLAGGYSRLENDLMAAALLKNFKLFGPPQVMADDVRRAKRLGLKGEFHRRIETEPSKQGRGSSDEDSVSWLAPFGCLRVACVAKGTTSHHRDYAAQMKSPYAHRGLLRAAEILAATAVDLLTNETLLNNAKAEFKKRRKGFRYDPLIPRGQKPPTVNP